MAALLTFQDYSMGFRDDNGEVYNLLDHVNFSLEDGHAVGVVGESGCGKTWNRAPGEYRSGWLTFPVVMPT